MMGYGPSPSHRCDEFPAEYSSASCSPAELASASSATLMLQPITFVRRANLSERQLGNSLTVSLQGVTALRSAPRAEAQTAVAVG
jgi:hypothetical protein